MPKEIILILPPIIFFFILCLCFFLYTRPNYNPYTRDIMEDLSPKERGRVYETHPQLRKYLVDLEMVDYNEPPEDVSPIDFPEWDIKNVDNITEMFSKCTAFNQDISDWDLSNVASYLEMFANMSPEEEMEYRRLYPDVMKQVDKDRALADKGELKNIKEFEEINCNFPEYNWDEKKVEEKMFEKDFVGMKIFEKDDRVNFVDSNDVFLGYEIEQKCCESHGWFIIDELLTKHDFREDTVEQHSDFDGWLFDRDFYLTYSHEKEDGREIGTVVFRIKKGEEEKYIYIFNEHNGYYAHGFSFKVGERTVYDDQL